MCVVRASTRHESSTSPQRTLRAGTLSRILFLKGEDATSTMWSSEHTPVLVPVNIGDAYWSGEFSAPHSPVHVEPICPQPPSRRAKSRGGEVGKMVQERMGEEKKQRQVDEQERGRTVGKKRAVFGAVRRLLSRSRSASRSGRERSISLDYARVGSPTTVGSSSTYNSEPAPRLLFLARPKSKASATAGRDGCADRPRPDRLGREENFHLAMDNKLVHMAFAAFCKKTFAAENIEFVRQVR